MADFDIVSKYLMQHYPDDFARFALGRDDVEGAEVIDPEQLTVEARQTDSLLRVQLDGEEVPRPHRVSDYGQYAAADGAADGRLYRASR